MNSTKNDESNLSQIVQISLKEYIKLHKQFEKNSSSRNIISEKANSSYSNQLNSSLSREDHIKLHEQYAALKSSNARTNSSEISFSNCNSDTRSLEVNSNCTNQLKSSSISREDHIKMHEKYASIKASHSSEKSISNRPWDTRSAELKRNTTFVLGELPPRIKEEPKEPVSCTVVAPPASQNADFEIVIKPIEGSSVQDIVSDVVQTMCNSHNFRITIKQGPLDINVCPKDMD